MNYFVHHQYFCRLSNKKKAIKDQHLLLVIILASSIPVVLFTVFNIYTGVSNGFIARNETNVEKPNKVEGVRLERL